MGCTTGMLQGACGACSFNRVPPVRTSVAQHREIDTLSGVREASKTILQVDRVIMPHVRVPRVMLLKL